MTPLDTPFQSDFEAIIRQTKEGNVKVLAEEVIQQTSSKIVFKATPSVDQLDYTVPKVFYPLIFTSKWMGLCPVKIIRTAGPANESIIYEFKWVSLRFLIVFCAGIGSGFVLMFWSLNAILDIGWPARIFSAGGHWLDESLLKSSSLILTLNNLSKLFLPLGAWMTVILSWSDTESLCAFLNEWPVFMKSYRSAFSSYYNVRSTLHKARNISVTFWFTPVVIIVLSLKPVNFLDHEVDSWLLGYSFVYLATFHALGIRALSYVKDFLLLKTIHAAYEETLNGIKSQYGAVGKMISREQVRDWMDLITFIRLQTSRVEKHMSCQNLWSVFEIFASVLLILSTVVFLFMNNELEKSLSGNFLHFSIFSTVFFICSLYWKTGIAEHITSTEEDIADELLEMENADGDCETRLEMKLIFDMIYNDPVRVELGSILTLNKKLLLSFFSQLASYLVVILQFTK